ncbi:nitroreductase [Crossiella equi]|uniref:Nitroreductase n=1 Tax=Crossiella equi TaxID=130796 RepID=A0ABS5AG44_9PSEU|nr:nitroreductase family protein [Crossiella equi]MBP2475311.1 nitroreductase [Crossiella equi]
MSDRRAPSSVPLHDLLATRWSPRVLDPGAEVTDPQLRALFEAARWAPSWGNTQPARFVVGRRGDEVFKKLADTMTEGNKRWAEVSSVLVLGLVATQLDDGKPMPYAEYGLGLATQNLVLQAVAEGLVAHQMAGFSKEGAKAVLSLPEGFEPVVLISVGSLGSLEGADERLVAKDTAPRSRKPLAELVFTEWGEPAF